MWKRKMFFILNPDVKICQGEKLSSDNVQQSKKNDDDISNRNVKIWSTFIFLKKLLHKKNVIFQNDCLHV